MTPDEKIKWVRDRVCELEELGSLKIWSYPLEPVMREVAGDINELFVDFFSIEKEAATGKKQRQEVVAITVGEQVDILKRLEGQQLIKIQEIQSDKVFLEVLPKHPSPIKLRTLEHIARRLSDKFSGTEIVDTLLGYGIPRSDIPYPNTKWRTLLETFSALAMSPNPEQREKFGGAITTFLHPLNFGADEGISHELIEDFNKYLKYDGYEIAIADDGDGFTLTQTKDKTRIGSSVKQKTSEGKPAEQAEEVIPLSPKKVSSREEYDEYSDGVEREIEILRTPKNAEDLAIVREAYKTLMAIASSFCIDPTTPSRELNAAYTQLERVVSKELETTYCGGTTPFSTFRLDHYKDDNFGIPFRDLYSAELSFKRNGRELHWDEARPAMNAMLGQIEELCETADAPDVISDPKVQKVISDAMVLLSEIAAKRKSIDDTVVKPTIKMEITKMPELQVRSAEASTITKGKRRLHLPKFKATDWSKVVIRFIDERTVVITADKKDTISADYESLGFSDDKRGKPNSAWALLYTLAKNSGETKPLGTPIPDNVKQHKRQLSNRLKDIFKNETDPFYDSTETHTYRIKVILIPPQTEETKPDRLGVDEYLKEVAIEKYE